MAWLEQTAWFGSIVCSAVGRALTGFKVLQETDSLDMAQLLTLSYFDTSIGCTHVGNMYTRCRCGFMYRIVATVNIL